MTSPAAPTTGPTPNDMPGAPATPAAPAPAAPAAPAPTPSSEVTAAQSGLADEERAELARLRAVHKEEGKWENRSKANAKKLRDLAEELGLDPSEFNPSEFDPKAEFGKLRQEVAEEREARTRSEVARTEGVDPDILTGKTEDEMRAAAQRYKASVEAGVAKALEGKEKPPPSAAPASTVTSGGKIEGLTQITSRDELKKMTREQILAADKEGRLDQLKGKTS